jgi:hypothetical protein
MYFGYIKSSTKATVMKSHFFPVPSSISKYKKILVLFNLRILFILLNEREP